MFLDLYIQIPYPVSTRSAPLLAGTSRSFVRAFAHRALVRVEKATTGIDHASPGKEAMTREQGPAAELSPSRSGNGAGKEARDLILIDG